MNKTDLGEFLLKGNLNLLPATFLDDKDAQIISKLVGITRYWPDEDLNPALLLSLLRLPREFKRIRNILHIRRIICAEFFYKKAVIKSCDQYPQKRHLLVKLFKTRLEFPFGHKDVLGIFVTFNIMKQREAFEEGHILEAIRNIIPDAEVVKGSFIDTQDKKNQAHSVYLEIERTAHPQFTLKELKQLQEQLPVEFKGCIQQLVPVTFMRRNEEEVYRNIVALRDQLRSIRDIPQTTITFEEQTQFDLFFTVVLLRLVKNHASSVQEIFQKKHPNVVFIPDRVDQLGMLRNQYVKEASVFRLQLPKSQFFRKDRSVNIYKARQKVLAMLEQALGPVRDYNGGLILKQNERLEDFLALMSKNYDEFFLENFFYSITPIAMQSILPAMLIKEWFLAFSELLNRELGRGETYFLLCRHIEEVQMVILRAENGSFKEILLKEINQLGIPSLEYAFSEVNIHGTFCFGFLYRPSLITENLNFCNKIKEAMVKWSEQVAEGQTLRILIQGSHLFLDPRIKKEDQSFIVISMLFEGLTRIGIDGQPTMAMAESYTVSNDFKTFTFHLRDCLWSNGSPVSAYDFEYTWKKALNHNLPTIFSHNFNMIKNASLARKKKVSIEQVGVFALDDKTLRIDLEYPVLNFLEIVAHWTYSPINHEMDQKHPDWANQAGENFVCNGPFKLMDWKQTRSLSLSKNPSYWDAQSVNLDKILIAMAERPFPEISLLNKGELDMVGRPLVSFQSQWLNQAPEEIERVSFLLNGVYSIFFNTMQFPFNNKKIRQAFANAIPRNLIPSLVPQEFGDVSYSLLPQGLSLHTEPLFIDENLALAQRFFHEGLNELKVTKNDIPRLSLIFFNGNQRLPLFKTICKQWQDLFGIEIQIRYYEWETLLQRFTSAKHHMGCIELNACWNDPLHLLEIFEEKSHSFNFANWEDPEFQKLLRDAKMLPLQGENDHVLKKRCQFLKEAEALLAEEVPAVPLYQIAGHYFKKNSLKNVGTSANFQIDYKWAYKEAQGVE